MEAIVVVVAFILIIGGLVLSEIRERKREGKSPLED